MEATTVIAEPFEVRRRNDLRAKIVELDNAMTDNRAAIGRLQICVRSSYGEAQQALDVLTNERGKLLADWNRTLSELAQL